MAKIEEKIIKEEPGSIPDLLVTAFSLLVLHAPTRTVMGEDGKIHEKIVITKYPKIKGKDLTKWAQNKNS